MMDEELYDPECSACERAQKDYADLERVTDDLAALVRRLARSLRKAAPDHDLPSKALDYLARNGLQGSPLRDGDAVHNAAYPTNPSDKPAPTTGDGAHAPPVE